MCNLVGGEAKLSYSIILNLFFDDAGCVKYCITHHLEANLGLLVQALKGVGLVDLSVVGAATRVVRVLLLVLLSLVSLWILGHGVDFPLGGVQHDRQDLQVSQQPQLAEARPFAALPHQQLGQA